MAGEKKRLSDSSLEASSLTIRDVAQLAGVSPATVSNVLNGTGRVSETTAKRVREVVDASNFKLNATARTLRQRSSRLIGVLVPLDEQATFEFNPYYWHFVDGVMQIAEEHGYDVILKAIVRDATPDIMHKRDLDGVIVIGAFDSSLVTESVISSGVSCVFVDSYISHQNVNLVNLDDRFGSYLAARHLLGLGHRKILFVSGQLTPDGVDHERFLGFEQALQESGCSMGIAPIQADISLESGKALAHRLAYEMNGITGIVTTADALAIGLLRGFKECGIAVPQQLSIVGFDDIPQSAFTIPSITTIHQDVHDKGFRAGQRLLQLINGNPNGKQQHLRLTPELVVRESTGEVPRA